MRQASSLSFVMQLHMELPYCLKPFDQIAMSFPGRSTASARVRDFKIGILQ